MIKKLFGGIARGRKQRQSGRFRSPYQQPTEVSSLDNPRPAKGEAPGMSRRDFLVWSAASAAFVAGARSFAFAEPSPRTKVGIIVPEQGELAAEARSLVAGFEFFLKEKGPKAPPLEILKKHTGPDDANTLEAVSDLAMNQEVRYLIGPPSLEGSEKTIWGLAEAKSIVFVTNPAVRLVAGELCFPRSFRLGPNSYQAARPLAPWALKNVGNKVFITGDDNVLGNSEADFFAHGFERAGGQFVDRVMVPGTEDFKKILDAVAESKPDMVFAAFHGLRAVSFLDRYSKASPKLDRPIIGPEGLTSFPETLSGVGKNCTGVRTLTNMRNPKELVSKIKATLNQDVVNAAKAAEGYDIAGVICAVESGKPPETDPQKIVESIRNLEIEGYRGKIRFDANHEPIIQVMVQEWTLSGTDFKQKIVADLGPFQSLDFGCGHVGFPRKPDSEPKDEQPEELRNDDSIWEDEGQ